MNLSEKIKDFLEDLEDGPENYSMSEVMGKLEEFAYEVELLEDERDDLESDIADLEEKIEALENEISTLEEN